MEFGFYLPNNGPTSQPDDLAEIARHGDRLGYHSMVVGDHVLVPKQIDSPYPYTVSGEFPGGEAGEYLEQLTLLTFLAGITQKIRLVPSVMIVPYRNPLLAAKILATLDVLSKGRLTLGVGVGWMEEEFQALDAPPFSQRGEVTNEYLQIFKELWTSDNPSFDGEHYQFSGINFLPKPVQKPHPPIWVGGQSRRAIRRAAQLGNGWHPVGAIPAAPLEPEDLAGDLPEGLDDPFSDGPLSLEEGWVRSAAADLGGMDHQFQDRLTSFSRPIALPDPDAPRPRRVPRRRR